MVIAVVFDVGETLLDDTRKYGASTGPGSRRPRAAATTGRPRRRLVHVA